MAVRKSFKYKSSDGGNTVHGLAWTPENGEVKAVLQIVHGMVERIERYDHFAAFMADHGFAVVGEDHLGHGKTAAYPDDLGYFAKKDGARFLVEDVHQLTQKAKDKFPGVPFFILGHSMGSYITRNYLNQYGREVNAAVLSGTGWQTPIETGMGNFACNVVKLFKGDKYRSKLLTKVAFGSYLKKIENPRTKDDWMCTDNQVIDDFQSDELCGCTFTVNGYQVLIQLVTGACGKDVANVPKNLPVFLIAGEEDPVGQYGAGVLKVDAQYRTAGLKNVTTKLYPSMRHEVLNEIGKEDVYDDVLRWLELYIK